MSYVMRMVEPENDYEPVLMLAKPKELVVRRFKPVRFAEDLLSLLGVEPVTLTKPMVYGINGTPRCRMRHQVQLGEGAPAWRGCMPTFRYEVINAH